MEIIERIYETMEKKNKHAVELCARLQIRASTMSTWKSRTSDPPAKYMKTIADFLEVSLDYLLTGQEPPTKGTASPEEEELLTLFRSLPDSKKHEFIGELKGFLRAYKETQSLTGKSRDLY